MRLVIEKEEYDLPYGISLLKTLHGDNYNDLPEDFKHKEIKKRWEKYKGIPKKLYSMTKSRDVETLELAIKLLEEEKTKFFQKHNTIWTSGGTEKVLSSVKVFLTIDEQRWNNYK
jgi:ferritin-like protein